MARASTTKSARSAERSLVRYVTRVASRPDLFGLAGAYSVGRFGEHAVLEFPPASSWTSPAFIADSCARSCDALPARPPWIARRWSGVTRGPTARAGVCGSRPQGRLHRTSTRRSQPHAHDRARTCCRQRGCCDRRARRRPGIRRRGRSHALQVLRRLIASELLLVVADVTTTGSEPTAQASEALASLPRGAGYAEAVRAAAAAVRVAANRA